tara:strand:+ start:875 stop:1681 length:807 start_codon:yes stop_codon:yes gene_type:complete
MKKYIFLLLIVIPVISCDISSDNNQGTTETNNYIQWSNGNELHDEMIRSGINHFLNIEREKAYVFFEKATKLDSSSFAAHVVIASMSRPNSEKQEIHYELAKKHSMNKNENSKRFVSLLDIKSKNGNRGIWGSSAEKNSIWEEMYDAEPRGRFIQFYRATSSPDLNQRIKKLEELREKWGEPNNAAVINYLGYLYYQSGNKEKSKETFMKYLELYPDGYNSYDSMAEFFMFEKDYEEAKKYYEMVLDVFPFSNSALTSLNEIEKLLKN